MKTYSPADLHAAKQRYFDAQRRHLALWRTANSELLTQIKTEKEAACAEWRLLESLQGTGVNP